MIARHDFNRQIDDLQVRLDMWDCDSFIFTVFMNEMIINDDMFCPFVKFWIC